MRRQWVGIVAWILLVAVLLGFNHRDYLAKQNSMKRPSVAEPRCRQAYERLFSKESIDIRVVFGYKDSRPARFVGDLYEKNALIENMVAPCEGDRFDCGFSRIAEDADLLEKKMIGLDGKPRQVLLKIVSSAVGPDDDENRRNRFQEWKSQFAENQFFEGIRQADVVFYNGHGRDGGGPDFEPPKLLKNQHVNYGWYVAANRGPKKIQKALTTPERRAKLIGLYSCVSNKLIPKTGESEKVGWIASAKLVYYADALQGVADALSSLLGMKCQNEFKYGNAETGSSISHFFL